jgi:hypothetical protein
MVAWQSKNRPKKKIKTFPVLESFCIFAAQKNIKE